MNNHWKMHGNRCQRCRNCSDQFLSLQAKSGKIISNTSGTNCKFRYMFWWLQEARSNLDENKLNETHDSTLSQPLTMEKAAEMPTETRFSLRYFKPPRQIRSQSIPPMVPVFVRTPAKTSGMVSRLRTRHSSEMRCWDYVSYVEVEHNVEQTISLWCRICVCSTGVQYDFHQALALSWKGYELLAGIKANPGKRKVDILQIDGACMRFAVTFPPGYLDMMGCGTHIPAHFYYFRKGACGRMRDPSSKDLDSDYAPVFGVKAETVLAFTPLWSILLSTFPTLQLSDLRIIEFQRELPQQQGFHWNEVSRLYLQARHLTPDVWIQNKATTTNLYRPKSKCWLFRRY